MPHVIVLKYHPHHLTRYECKGTKIWIFKVFSELGKCGNAISLWIEKNSPRLTFQNPNVEFMDELGNLRPNLTFTVENKMGNSHKRGWSYFKLNINDWYIPFPKILRIYHWIGKNIFHYRENGMNPL